MAGPFLSPTIGPLQPPTYSRERDVAAFTQALRRQYPRPFVVLHSNGN